MGRQRPGRGGQVDQRTVPSGGQQGGQAVLRRGQPFPGIRPAIFLDQVAGPGQSLPGQAVFGAELRYYRERAGLSQADLAALVNVSHDVISKIETGERPSAKDFPERLDAVPGLDTRVGLARLWGNLRKGLRHRAIPGWFQPWTHFEAQAATLRSYEPPLVPGLLQTEDYARAILAARPGGKHDDLDDQVAARMDRQAILADGPQLWCVVDEGVLHRCVGSAKVMHDQLEHLADLAENPQTTILSSAMWRKSSRSGGSGGNGVEVARNLPGVVAVRDSKNPGGPVLTIESAGWQDFIADVKAGYQDLSARSTTASSAT